MSEFSKFQSAYCQNCGQICTPEQYTRPAEYYDLCSGQIQDYRSPCCKDELSEDPVSDRCDYCGATVWINVPDKDIVQFILADGDLLCPSCLADHRIDHPDWETLVAEAEMKADAKEDR